MNRVRVAPALLRWAQLRSGRDVFDLAERFPKLAAWERGETQPTFKQLEQFANATHVPVGALFLEEPPEEQLPLSDFRTVVGMGKRPSGDLLDTIYLCQQRQAWLAEELQSVREATSPMVSRAIAGETPEAAAARAREVLGFEVAERPPLPPECAFTALSTCAESAGVLVMVSEVVGSDDTRPLNADEFRGFALVEPLAPLVFVNGAETKAAQVFTLAHGLGRLFRGESAIHATDLSDTAPTVEAERWCDAFAGELLGPESAVLALVQVETRVREAPRNFYDTLLTRVSQRFARGLVVGTLEGRIPYNRALRLLGFQKLSAFDELARRLGVSA